MSLAYKAKGLTVNFYNNAYISEKIIFSLARLRISECLHGVFLRPSIENQPFQKKKKKERERLFYAF